MPNPNQKAVEALAGDIAIRLGDDLFRRAALESAPEPLWRKPSEEDAWLKGRDDTVAHIEEEFEGCVRKALEDAAPIIEIEAERERVLAAVTSELANDEMRVKLADPDNLGAITGFAMGLALEHLADLIRAALNQEDSDA